MGMMQFHHRDFWFDLSDDWWREAGMQGFVPSAKSYPADHAAYPNQKILSVGVDDVEPVRRNLSHGVFNNDGENGRPAKDRVVQILRGFSSGNKIPPVQVVRLSSDSECHYILVDGAHRFYSSVAAGFIEVPAIDVSGIWL